MILEDERIYLAHVNKTLEYLRTRCLGQDTLMSDILPQAVRNRSLENQASQITETFLFALAKASGTTDFTAHKIAECRICLYHAILHIFQTEEHEARTFSTLKTLLSLPGNIRKHYFEFSPDQGMQTLYEQEPPCLLQNFDVALLLMLKVCNMNQSAENILGRLELLLVGN